MKRLIICACALLALAFAGAYASLYLGLSPIPAPGAAAEPKASFVQRGRQIYQRKDGTLVPFEVRGVDLGASQPGNFATDYAISRETYLRWFGQIQAMGANCIRTYILLGPAFYEAFCQYNAGRAEPLYLIHGVWVNDYANNSHMSAFDPELLGALKADVRTAIDVVHGRRVVELGRVAGTGSYTWDISPWTLGYLIGVEWEPSLVAYTNLIDDHRTVYEGTYLRTLPDAAPFEVFLAEVGDEALRYETESYGEQRLVAFSNWPHTDPFSFDELIQIALTKYAAVDVERIAATAAVRSGLFASYHVYPYFPDFLRFVPGLAQTTDAAGEVNTYYAYLRELARHHNIPVVISEFGVPTSRGRSANDQNTGRCQGRLTEREQAVSLVRCYRDIKDAGCAGCVLFIWQDEWFKRSWNTWPYTDTLKNPSWCNVQTPEQCFGLLTFDPGEERPACVVDGVADEWDASDEIGRAEGLTLSARYDERALYLLVSDGRVGEGEEGADVGTAADERPVAGDGLAEGEHAEADERPSADEGSRAREGADEAEGPGAAGGARVRPETPLYLPFDVTPRSGSKVVEGDERLTFARDADFLLVLDGRDNTHLLVQERYEALRATSLESIANRDPYLEPPARHSAEFRPIYLMLETSPLRLDDGRSAEEVAADPPRNPVDALSDFVSVYETGWLRHGNGDPEAANYDSLADFCFGEGCVELRLPWELLNFSNPSEMQVHDDYYACYGVENLAIESLWAGVGTGAAGRPIPLFEKPLAGWGDEVTYHERLKEGYFVLKRVWGGELSPESYLAEASAEGVDLLRDTAVDVVSYAETYYGPAAETAPTPAERILARAARVGAAGREAVRR